MKVRIHTYQVQRITYEVDVENEAGAEEAARLWFEEAKPLDFQSLKRWTTRCAPTCCSTRCWRAGTWTMPPRGG